LARGSVDAIPNRSLDESTCRRYGYEVGEIDGKKCHIATHKGANGLGVVQNIRFTGKKFQIRGDSKQFGFYGDWLFPGGGKYLCITEGEIDCLSVSQAFGNKYPVVSLPHGVKSAKKAVQKRYEWLELFDAIILMFDTDEPGKAAAAEVAEMLPPGKVKIASLPLKDANECLMAGQTEAIVKAFWNARPFRPDGIVMATDLRTLVTAELPMGLSYPWEGINGLTRGIRDAELVTITAGSGLGKTTFVREIAYHLHWVHKEPIGMLMLEEGNRKTLRGLTGLHMNKNLIVDDANPAEIDAAFAALFAEKDIALYDHFGSTEVENICQRIRYMVKACGVRRVILDHLSIMVSGLNDGDERKLIDVAMTKLRSLVEETKCTLFAVSHLKRPQGDKGHEDGAQVRLGQLRGSHAIVQLSDFVIGLQKPEEDVNGDSVEAVILKNRFTGEKGSAGLLNYNRDTGRLTESAF
jgi:twinkle protein